jgi:hypothetical protein
MDAFHDNNEETRKIGIHINSEFQVALVSSDVLSNSAKITENSATYLDGKYC